MIANTLNNQLLYSEGKSMIRSASVISFSIHILIIGIAMFGLPKFGRQLPPDLTIISFEMLKVIEETNLEIKEDIQEKGSIFHSENPDFYLHEIEQGQGSDIAIFLYT